MKRASARRLSLTAALAAALSAAACTGGGGGEPEVRLSADLDLDIRATARVEIALRGADLEASVTLGDGMGVAPTGVPLEGRGRVHDFPEAGAVLYAARVSSPPVVDGPCASEPISLALTLRRANGNVRVAGGLAAYCGAGVWSGTPARILRLSGEMPAG